MVSPTNPSPSSGVVALGGHPLAWLRSLDLTDAAAMGAIRARVLGLAIMLGFVASVATSLTNPVDPAHSNAWLFLPLAPMPLLGLYALVAGSSMRDISYVVTSAAIEIGMITFLLLTTIEGALRSQSTIFLFPTVQAALFCGRRRHVALMTVVAATGASLLSLHRLAGSGEAPAEVSGGIFTYVLIAVVVRLLRDVAHASVERARRGEVTDPLTGLANRRGFERSGAESWARRAQERKPLVLLLVDVDHFKRVNDTLGHAAGDELLRKVATLLQSTLREGDLAFRLGGEEFAVLVRALPGEGAALGERLRARVEETLPVTVSIGAVEATPGSELDVTARLWRIVDRADGGLYEAKRGGRNRVVEVAADVPA